MGLKTPIVSVTIRGGDTMTRADKRRIAVWLRRWAAFLVTKDGAHLSRKLTLRYTRA